MDYRLYNVLNNLGNFVMNNKIQNLRYLYKRKENIKKIFFDNIFKKFLNRNYIVIFF